MVAKSCHVSVKAGRERRREGGTMGEEERDGAEEEEVQEEQGEGEEEGDHR